MNIDGFILHIVMNMFGRGSTIDSVSYEAPSVQLLLSCTKMGQFFTKLVTK